MDELHFWLWTVTDLLTKRRRQLGYRMIAETARERFGTDAVKVDTSLEVRKAIGSTGAWQQVRR